MPAHHLGGESIDWGGGVAVAKSGGVLLPVLPEEEEDEPHISEPIETAPVITSDGGGATASVNVAENTTAVTTVTASDADLPKPDADLFDQRRGRTRRPGSRSTSFDRGAELHHGPQLRGPDRRGRRQRLRRDGPGLRWYVERHAGHRVTITALNDDAPVITTNGGGPPRRSMWPRTPPPSPP